MTSAADGIELAQQKPVMQRLPRFDRQEKFSVRVIARRFPRYVNRLRVIEDVNPGPAPDQQLLRGLLRR